MFHTTLDLVQGWVNEGLGSLFYFILLFLVELLVYWSFCSFVGNLPVRSSFLLWSLLAQNLWNILQCVVQHREPSLSLAPIVTGDMVSSRPELGIVSNLRFRDPKYILGLVLSTATLSSGNISWQLSIIATTWIC